MELIVELVLMLLLSFSQVLLPNLPVELILDESLPFLLPHESLFLLLIVEDGVEVLNGRPLILFIQVAQVVNCIGS